MDSTSVYRITDAVGMTDNVHPGARSHALADQGINADVLMGIKISALEPWWQNGRINPAYRAREVTAG